MSRILSSQRGMENVGSLTRSPRHTSESYTCRDASFKDSHTETERWLLVRKSLLETQKFAKIFDEISEAEWLKFRTASLNILLDCCSNFHGGPTGEMWNTVTSAVKNHLGPQHDFLALISNHQESLWTTCSLVTVTTLSEGSLEEKGMWKDSDVQMSASMPSTPAHQAYGSIDLIEPSGKDGRRVCMHHFNWKWLILYVPLLLALVAVIAIAVTLAKIKPETTRRVEALEGATVYLDTQKSVWYEGWHVSECSPSSGLQLVSGSNRNRTMSKIQLVDSEDVIYYEENVMDDEVEGYQTSTLLKTLNGPLYLLAGSSVEYEFCLTTNISGTNGDQPHFELFGEFLIFNDITSYANYVHQSGNRGKEAAIFYQKTPIPGISREESCTTVTFNISQADFYFTMYRMPPHVELHYQANIHVVYLNYTKYIPNEESECRIVSGGSCIIKIPETIFSTEDYTILAYILLQTDTAPNPMDLCVTPKQSLLVSVIPGAILAFILLVLLVVLVCQIISYLGNIKRRKGYFCIKPINM